MWISRTGEGQKAAGTEGGERSLGITSPYPDGDVINPPQRRECINPDPVGICLYTCLND